MSFPYHPRIPLAHRATAPRQRPLRRCGPSPRGSVPASCDLLRDGWATVRAPPANPCAHCTRTASKNSLARPRHPTVDTTAPPVAVAIVPSGALAGWLCPVPSHPLPRAAVSRGAASLCPSRWYDGWVGHRLAAKIRRKPGVMIGSNGRSRSARSSPISLPPVLSAGAAIRGRRPPPSVLGGSRQ